MSREIDLNDWEGGWADNEDQLTLYAFICVHCGKHSDSSSDRFTPCTAPDGDGHLFKRTKLSSKP